MTDAALLRKCAELAESKSAFVLVTLAEAIGSTPQDAGAKMIVTADGLASGTVGGGRVEAKAIDHARSMLTDSRAGCTWVDWNLKADAGMTCGGRVRLVFDCIAAPAWQVVIFGAGHVAQALTRLLDSLPCGVTCVDPRDEWLVQLPSQVKRIQLASPADYVDSLPAGCQVVCMTQGHKTDLPVLHQLYSIGRDVSFVGVIGSAAKAAALRKELTATGIDPAKLIFHCPVGLPIGSHHPGEIAVSIAAQLLSVRI